MYFTGQNAFTVANFSLNDVSWQFEDYKGKITDIK